MRNFIVAMSLLVFAPLASAGPVEPVKPREGKLGTTHYKVTSWKGDRAFSDRGKHGYSIEVTRKDGTTARRDVIVERRTFGHATVLKQQTPDNHKPGYVPFRLYEW